MQQKRNIWYGLILAFMLVSCSLQDFEPGSGELIQGDLFVKLISMYSLYGADAQQKASFAQMLDSLSHLESPSENEVKLVETFRQLEKWGLMYSPSFYLRTQDGEVYRVYINEDEYARIKTYELNELLDENRKLSMRLKGEFLSKGVFRADRITQLEEMEGTTYWKK